MKTKKQNNSTLGLIMLIAGLILILYLSLSFIVSKFLGILISIALVIGGQYLIHKK